MTNTVTFLNKQRHCDSLSIKHGSSSVKRHCHLTLNSPTIIASRYSTLLYVPQISLVATPAHCILCELRTASILCCWISAKSISSTKRIPYLKPMIIKESTCEQNDEFKQDGRHIPNPSVVTEGICSLMQSEKALSLADVTLISSEGTKIPALRTILVMRSSYFEKLLTSPFAEKKRSTIHVSIRTFPLRCLLHFIYTDNIPTLEAICSERCLSLPCDFAVKIIELAFAADYTSTESLLSWCLYTLKHIIKESREDHFLCLLVQELWHKHISWAQDLLRMVSRHLTYQALLCGNEECPFHCGFMHLEDKVMARVLEELRIRYNGFQESIRFQLILVWATGGTSLLRNWSQYIFCGPGIILDVNKLNFLEERLAVAKQMAKGFDLTVFTPTFISEVVEPSGLIAPNIVNEVYKRLAVTYERHSKRSIPYV